MSFAISPSQPNEKQSKKEERSSRFDAAATIGNQYEELHRERQNRRSYYRPPNPFIGTCLAMCPEYERHEREIHLDLSTFEIIPGTESNKGAGEYPRVDHDRAVKKYHRPAAGNETPFEDDIRPPHILKQSLDYLVRDVLPLGYQSDGACFVEVHNFIRDRTRSIRQDLTIQHRYIQSDQQLAVLSISIHEIIARFHILSIYQAAEEKTTVSGGSFDHFQNWEQLRKVLQSLQEYYDDIYYSAKREAVGLESGSFKYQKEAQMHENEFRAYYLLVHYNDQSIFRKITSLSANHLKSSELCYALSLLKAYRENNYVRFFNLIDPHRQPPGLPVHDRMARYLQLCCLFTTMYNEVRKNALLTFSKTYSKSEIFSYAELKRLLKFPTYEGVALFLEYYGLSVKRENGTEGVFFDKGDYDKIKDAKVGGISNTKDPYLMDGWLKGLNNITELVYLSQKGSLSTPQNAQTHLPLHFNDHVHVSTFQANSIALPPSPFRTKNATEPMGQSMLVSQIKPIEEYDGMEYQEQKRKTTEVKLNQERRQLLACTYNEILSEVFHPLLNHVAEQVYIYETRRGFCESMVKFYQGELIESVVKEQVKKIAGEHISHVFYSIYLAKKYGLRWKQNVDDMVRYKELEEERKREREHFVKNLLSIRGHYDGHERISYPPEIKKKKMRLSDSSQFDASCFQFHSWLDDYQFNQSNHGMRFRVLMTALVEEKDTVMYKINTWIHSFIRKRERTRKNALNQAAMHHICFQAQSAFDSVSADSGEHNFILLIYISMTKAARFRNDPSMVKLVFFIQSLMGAQRGKGQLFVSFAVIWRHDTDIKDDKTQRNIVEDLRQDTIQCLPVSWFFIHVQALLDCNDDFIHDHHLMDSTLDARLMRSLKWVDDRILEQGENAITLSRSLPSLDIIHLILKPLLMNSFLLPLVDIVFQHIAGCDERHSFYIGLCSAIEAFNAFIAMALHQLFINIAHKSMSRYTLPLFSPSEKQRGGDFLFSYFAHLAHLGYISMEKYAFVTQECHALMQQGGRDMNRRAFLTLISRIIESGLGRLISKDDPPLQYLNNRIPLFSQSYQAWCQLTLRDLSEKMIRLVIETEPVHKMAFSLNDPYQYMHDELDEALQRHRDFGHYLKSVVRK